jgi:hypothetical protein
MLVRSSIACCLAYAPLVERYVACPAEVHIPSETGSPRVFDRAIAECRARTLPHVQLPADESFTVEYVTNKPWSGYNWYQGNYRSLIQVNTDLPIYIDRAIDLACHEGYPGHHVYNALLEKQLVRDRGWVEFHGLPLFSPQSLIAEGTPITASRVAFPRRRASGVRDRVRAVVRKPDFDPSQAAAVRPLQTARGCAWPTPATRRRARM